MSQENVDLVLQACAAWERLDPGEIAAFYAPDAELVSQRAEMSGRTYHGREGLREWIADFSAPFHRSRMEFQEVVDTGQWHGPSRWRGAGAELVLTVWPRSTEGPSVFCVDVADALQVLGWHPVSVSESGADGL